MQIIFTPAARAEMLDAYDWYEAQQPNLGGRFQQAIEAVVVRMENSVFQFPIVFQDIRRARLRKFPYALFFRVEPEGLIVIACFHGSRDPRHWQRRV